LKKISIILGILCAINLSAQTTDELVQLHKIIKKADTLFKQRKYKKALNLYERAYKLCECKYPYDQIRCIKDGNLIIRNRNNNTKSKNPRFL
jgi:hypothetical protein